MNDKFQGDMPNNIPPRFKDAAVFSEENAAAEARLLLSQESTRSAVQAGDRTSFIVELKSSGADPGGQLNSVMQQVERSLHTNIDWFGESIESRGHRYGLVTITGLQTDSNPSTESAQVAPVQSVTTESDHEQSKSGRLKMSWPVAHGFAMRRLEAEAQCLGLPAGEHPLAEINNAVNDQLREIEATALGLPPQASYSDIEDRQWALRERRHQVQTVIDSEGHPRYRERPVTAEERKVEDAEMNARDAVRKEHHDKMERCLENWNVRPPDYD
jgi:hypothetical protein